MTVADGTMTADEDDRTDGDTGATGARRRRDRTGVSDRPRENRSPAAQRAIDRRRKRATQRSTATIAGRRRADGNLLSRLGNSPGELVRRVPFVVLVIAILAMGLGLTLWLSTTAAQDSYQLSVQRQQNQDLMDRRDALKKSFEAGDSAPEIASAATKFGMIPAKDVARYVIGADGRATIVGDVTPATGTAGPSLASGSNTDNTVPQPGAPASGAAARPSATPIAPGADLTGTAQTGSSGPIAANVLPPSVSAPAPSVPTASVPMSPTATPSAGRTPAAAPPASPTPVAR